jgi:hypothetical protein
VARVAAAIAQVTVVRSPLLKSEQEADSLDKSLEKFSSHHPVTALTDAQLAQSDNGR